MFVREEPVGQGDAVVSWRTMDSRYRTMYVAGSSDSSLVDTFDLGRIESSLLQRKNELIQASSWMTNIVMLVLVAAGFGCFLYIQYHATAKEEEETKRIIQQHYFIQYVPLCVMWSPDVSGKELERPDG